MKIDMIIPIAVATGFLIFAAYLATNGKPSLAIGASIVASIWCVIVKLEERS